MDYTRLGRSGLSASRLVLGTGGASRGTSGHFRRRARAAPGDRGGLREKLCADLGELFPAPGLDGGRPAPEAYAW